jgi:glycosyltransferase involved in cell wall biosynthesis
MFTGAISAELRAKAHAMDVRVINGRSRTISKLGLPFYAASVVGWMAKLLWIRPDIVHLNYSAYAPSLALAAYLLRIPVVSRATEYDPASRANRWISAFVANGKSHARSLLASPLAARVYIAGDLFRPERLSDTGTAAKPLTPRTGRPRFLFLGQLVPRKGIGVLINAFAQMRSDADLLLVGGDWNQPGYPAEMKTQIAGLGLADRIHLENHRTDIAALLRQCDVFVLPSLSEARPRSIIEAMCAGKPVLSTNVGGIPSLVDDGVTGLLVAADNVPQLAEALDRLAASTVLREQLGTAAAAKAQNEFQPEKTAARYYALYRSLATARTMPS